MGITVATLSPHTGGFLVLILLQESMFLRGIALPRGSLQEVLHWRDVLARVYLSRLCYTWSWVHVLDERIDTVISIWFNPAEKDIFATTASDRSIVLYDLRMVSPLNKLIMQTRNNAIAWNPREYMNFTAANEDCNCYS
jgi:hypothetical protein